MYPLLQVQLVSCLLPIPECECVGHSLHVASFNAATAVLYLPCTHSEHGAEPLTSLYVPAVHAAHAAPSGPVYPLLQVQLVSSPLPKPECECVGHSLHVASEIAAMWGTMAALFCVLPCAHSEHGAEPLTSLYVPAMHAEHCIPSGPVYPLLQVQLVSMQLPSGECVYAGHWLHFASSISPVSVEYFP